ncbi:hypothetical protein AGLY_011521 [Aphis glycines]|uniref:DUF8207 domain-containing protein n=1 Tax=Aphis glycines TaxID=307491 RepID=A0A6G0TD37_APHGL|nr:hypothetical protein AGLY_011521 [Aphis glycines]
MFDEHPSKSVIREYFSICRHSGASSVFYLAQTYSKIPKQLVRDNSNFLILLKQDDTNLRHIFNDHSSTDMDFIEFRNISHLCWNHSDYGFMVIDKTREMNEGRTIEQPNKKNTQPADEIKPETSDVSNDDNDNELNSSFSHFFNKRPTSKRYDKSYGMYYNKSSDSYKIGGHSVTFSHGNLQLFNKYYPWTEGLWSLLYEKEPKNTTLQDMESYYDILKTSRAHLKADGKPKTSKFHKWTNVVKPLYDKMKNEEKQLNEEIDKINNSRTPRLSLA